MSQQGIVLKCHKCGKAFTSNVVEYICWNCKFKEKK